jgi:Tfp pilus assembly protein PilN
MKAVNLIPAEERRTPGGSGSGLGSYILLGVLALVVALSALYTISNRTISDRRHELADVQARAQATSAEAQALQAYTSFTTLRQKRSETVRSLAASRFDWSHALHEVARTIPSDAWLTSMRATVTPSASVDGGVTDPLRSAVQAPAIEIVGCTTSQDKVANVISSLRRVDGVQRVSLSSSVKLAASTDKSSGADSAGASSADCRNGSSRFPQFSMTLFFQTPAAPAAATPAAAAPTASAPSTAKGTTP